jgi:hypothetical protein
MSKVILLHDDACPHTANLMKVTLTTLGWEITNCPPYSPDSAPSNFNLFRPMKVHLERQKFQNDDKLKGGVLNWL